MQTLAPNMEDMEVVVGNSIHAAQTSSLQSHAGKKSENQKLQGAAGRSWSECCVTGNQPSVISATCPALSCVAVSDCHSPFSIHFKSIRVSLHSGDVICVLCDGKGIPLRLSL